MNIMGITWKQSNKILTKLKEERTVLYGTPKNKYPCRTIAYIWQQFVKFLIAEFHEDILKNMQKQIRRTILLVGLYYRVVRFFLSSGQYVRTLWSCQIWSRYYEIQMIITDPLSYVS